jgi:hypothetical protein
MAFAPIRMFVSSTFADFTAEREALQRKAFPSIRSRARGLGADFQAIDLRWGVPERAAFEQRTLDICLTELRRCQAASSRPNLLILLGHRYGWRPAPAVLDAAEFEALADAMPTAEQTRVHHWYRRDDNARPAVFLLEPRQLSASGAPWDTEEDELRRSLERAAIRVFPAADRRLVKYQFSATHQEILEGLLQREVRPGEVFYVLREFENLPEDGTAGDWVDRRPDGLIDQDARQRLAELRQQVADRLGPEAVHRYRVRWPDGPTQAQLDDLCGWIDNAAGRVIVEEAAAQRTARRAVTTPTEMRYAAERSATFVGREIHLERIRAYVYGKERHPLAITGTSGSGKTALLSRATLDLAAQDPSLHLVARFIDAAPESADIRALLGGVADEVSGRPDAAGDYWQTVRRLNQVMSRRSDERLLVVVIDGLDQSPPPVGAQWLDWLPRHLPENVKLVLSVLDADGPAGASHRMARQLLPPTQIVQLGYLSAAESERLLDQWLADASRALRPEQRRAVLDRFAACAVPLYLRLVFEQARRWRSGDPVPEIAGSVAAVVSDFFSRLEHEGDHGSVLTHTLAYLCASRAGLSEIELLDVLSKDPDVLADIAVRSPRSPAVTGLPSSVWLRLNGDLGGYLMERNADETRLLGFHHRALSEAAADRVAALLPAAHRSLARYFGGDHPDLPQPDEFLDGRGGRTPHVRKAVELPYQQRHAGLTQELERTLGDLSFVAAKCASGLVYDLLDDYQHLDRGEMGAPTRATARLVQAEATAIAVHPATALQQMLNRATAVEDRSVIRAACLRTGRHFLLLHPSAGIRMPSSDAPVRVSQQTAAVFSVRETGDASGWALSGTDGLLMVCDKKTGRPRAFWSLRDLLSHTVMRDALCMAVADETALVGTSAGDVLAIDLRSGRSLERFSGHSDAILDITLAGSDEAFLTASHDGSVRLWRRGQPTSRATYRLDGSPIRTVHAEPGGRWFLTGRESGAVHRWPLDEAAEPELIVELPASVVSLELPADDRDVALVGASNGVWSVHLTRRTAQQLIHTDGHVRSVVRDPATATTWAGTMDGRLLCQSARFGRQQERWRFPGPVRALSLSSNSRRLGVATGDSVYEVDTSAPRVTATKGQARGTPLAVVCSAGLTTHVLARHESRIELWRIEDDRWTRTWRLDGVLDAGPSPDGRRLYLATEMRGIEEIDISDLADSGPRVQRIYHSGMHWRHATLYPGEVGAAVLADTADGGAVLAVCCPSNDVRTETTITSPFWVQDGALAVDSIVFSTPAGYVTAVDLKSGATHSLRLATPPMFGSAPPAIGGLLVTRSAAEVVCWTEAGLISVLATPSLEVRLQRRIAVGGRLKACYAADEDTLVCVDAEGTMHKVSRRTGHVETLGRLAIGPVQGVSSYPLAHRLIVWDAVGAVTMVDSLRWRELATWVSPTGVDSMITAGADGAVRIAYADSMNNLGLLVAEDGREPHDQ